MSRPAMALAELQRLLGPRGDGLDHLPSNPLPARIEMTPAVDARVRTSSRRSSRRWSGCPG